MRMWILVPIQSRLHWRNWMSSSCVWQKFQFRIPKSARIFCVRSVDLALRFFSKVAEYSVKPNADLVVADINLPWKSGCDLLEIH